MDARLLALAEYAAGALLSVIVAAVVHAVVDPTWDMVLAMLVGSVLGMVLDVLVGVLGPLISTFQVLIIGSLIGMYGGMLFAMRDTMQAASWERVVAVAISFGVAVVATVRLYDRALRGPAPAVGPGA